MVAPRKRALFLISVELDPIPGSFHTPKSWLDHFNRDVVLPPWYNADVQHVTPIFDENPDLKTFFLKETT